MKGRTEMKIIIETDKKTIPALEAFLEYKGGYICGFAQDAADVDKILRKLKGESARGVAESNKIIGDSLKGNEAYLRYLWIDGLNRNNQNVIYVPTEAGLLILEAGKRE